MFKQVFNIRQLFYVFLIVLSPFGYSKGDVTSDNVLAVFSKLFDSCTNNTLLKVKVDKVVEGKDGWTRGVLIISFENHFDGLKIMEDWKVGVDLKADAAGDLQYKRQVYIYHLGKYWEKCDD